MHISEAGIARYFQLCREESRTFQRFRKPGSIQLKTNNPHPDLTIIVHALGKPAIVQLRFVFHARKYLFLYTDLYMRSRFEQNFYVPHCIGIKGFTFLQTV